MKGQSRRNCEEAKNWLCLCIRHLEKLLNKYDLYLIIGENSAQVN